MRANAEHVRRAFTLLEMIVVVIVIGIMSALIIPRMGGNQYREYSLTVERVNDVVLMFAHRGSTSNQPAGLRFDSQRNQFELLTKVDEDGEYFWKPDPLARPVTLPDWFDEHALSIFVDGEYVDTMQWPITTTPGEARPLIEVALDWEEHSSLISLPAHAMGPNIWLNGEGTEPLMPIDLDASGQGREEW